MPTLPPASGTISVAHDSDIVTGVGTPFTAFPAGTILLVPGYGWAQIKTAPTTDT